MFGHNLSGGGEGAGHILIPPPPPAPLWSGFPVQSKYKSKYKVCTILLPTSWVIARVNKGRTT